LDRAQSLLATLPATSEQARDHCRGLLAAASGDVNLADGLLRRSHRRFAEAHGESSPAARRTARALAALWADEDPQASLFWRQRSVIDKQAPAPE